MTEPDISARPLPGVLEAPQLVQVSVIIPVFNNGTTLRELTTRICQTLATQPGGFEIAFVNDGSSDDSWKTIEELCGEHAHIIGVDLARNFGQHAGIKAGLHYANGRQLVLMDADLEDAPEHIPQLLAALTSDIDAVYTIVGEGRRRWTSAIFHRLTKFFTNSQAPAGVGTMRAFSRRFADVLLRHSERRPVWGPIMHALGFKFSTVSLPDEGRRKSSSYNFAKRARLATDYIIANTSVPFSLLFFLGVGLFVASLGYAAVVLGQYLFFGAAAPSGVALIVFLILTLFAFNFLFMAILGLYIHRVLIESLRRPLFVVAKSLNSSRSVLTG